MILCKLSVPERHVPVISCIIWLGAEIPNGSFLGFLNVDFSSLLLKMGLRLKDEISLWRFFEPDKSQQNNKKFLKATLNEDFAFFKGAFD